MICDICSRDDATVHVKEVINGNQRASNYCNTCALKKGIKLYTLGDQVGAKYFLELSLNDQSFNKEHEKKYSNLICSKCKLTFKEFQKTGRLGCPNCYQAFQKMLGRMLADFHSGSTHQGKQLFPHLRKKKEQ